MWPKMLVKHFSRRRWRETLTLAIFVGILSLDRLYAAGATVNHELIYPLDSGMIDVTQAPYNADKSGQTPADAAIQTAISDLASVGGGILFFPQGTYQITHALLWIDHSNNWVGNISLQGENSTGTILKIADNAAAFGSPCNADTWRQSAIVTGSYGAGQYSATGGTNGASNNAFTNHIWNMTIDTGHGNPCATGIDWASNNDASIRNVTVQSEDSGATSAPAGIAVDRGYNGPALIKNVTITGFKYGLYNTVSLADLTVDNLFVSGQSVAGVYHGDSQNGLVIENLTSVNTGPAISVNGYCSALTVVGGQFTETGSVKQSAIQIITPMPNAPNVSSPDAIYLRNITSTGYQSVISTSVPNVTPTIIPGTSVSEFTNTPAMSLGTTLPAVSLFSVSPAQSLGLPIQETPDLVETSTADWVNVLKSCGGGPSCVPAGNDFADVIQSAIDTPGATTIYFTAGTYRLSHPIHIRGSVQHLIGYGDVAIVPAPNFSNGGQTGAVIIDAQSPSLVVIDNIVFGINGYGQDFPFPTISDASPGTLVIRDTNYFTYSNQLGAGPLFLEDVASLLYDSDKPVFIPYAFQFNHQQVWARQLDPEVHETVALHAVQKVQNNGGAVWILDEKTEGNYSPGLVTTSGGVTELLGGAFFANGGPADPAYPIFLNQQGSQSLVFRTVGMENDSGYFASQIQEQLPGLAGPLLFADLNVPHQYGTWGSDTYMPLYTGYLKAPRLTAPIFTVIQPQVGATLAYGTTQTLILGGTDEPANCRWSSTLGTPYLSMTNLFSTTGGTAQSVTISGLTNGSSQSVAIRCMDLTGNVSPADTVVSFSVPSNAPAALPAPIINWPGTLAVGGELSVGYPPGFTIVSYQWTFSASAGDAAANGALSSTGFSAAFTTPTALAQLSSQNLLAGSYRVSVSAVDADGRISPAATGEITLIDSTLGTVHVYPNPVRSTRGDASVTFDQMPQGTNISIFNVAGREVKTLSAPDGTATWDLTNESGEKAASGIYLYDVVTPVGKTRGKLTLIR